MVSEGLITSTLPGLNEFFVCRKKNQQLIHLIQEDQCVHSITKVDMDNLI